MSMKRFHGILASLVCIIGLNPASATAADEPGNLLDYLYTVTFIEPGFTDVVNPLFTPTSGDPHDIFRFDGSPIGNGVMLSGESIDIEPLSIAFTLRGDGSTYPLNLAYQTTGFDPEARYRIELFESDGGGGVIPLASDRLVLGPAGVEVNQSSGTPSLDTILGVELGDELVIGDNFIELTVGTLGVLEDFGNDDLGTLTVNLEAVVIPVPAALPLMACGLAVFGLFIRKKPIS